MALYLRGTELVGHAGPARGAGPRERPRASSARASAPTPSRQADARIETVAASGRVPEHLELLRAAAQ